jgi:hypothetical protein
MKGLTIGGYGSEENSTGIIVDAPMTAAFIISGSPTNNDTLENISISDIKNQLTSAFISETSNHGGVMHNISMNRNPALSNPPIWGIYSTDVDDNEYSNITTNYVEGSFFSSSFGNNGQSIVIDNYVGGGGNLVIYTYGGLTIDRVYLENASIYITETTYGTNPLLTPAIKIDELGYMYTLNLYGVWNATISNTNYLDAYAAHQPQSVYLDPDCGNIIFINTGHTTSITNASNNPIFIIGQSYVVPMGKYMQMGNTYNQEIIQTDNGAITFSTTGMWLSSTTGHVYANGLRVGN